MWGVERPSAPRSGRVRSRRELIAGILVVLDEAKDFVRRQPSGTAQLDQFDQKAQATTRAWAFSTSRQQALIVPPVASRSSTNSTS